MKLTFYTRGTNTDGAIEAIEFAQQETAGTLLVRRKLAETSTGCDLNTTHPFFAAEAPTLSVIQEAQPTTRSVASAE